MKISDLHRPIQAVNIYANYINGNRPYAFDRLTSTADYEKLLNEVLEHFNDDKARVAFIKNMFIRAMEKI